MRPDRDGPVELAGDALLAAPLPAHLGDGTPQRPRLVVDTWLGVRAARGWQVLLLLRRPEEGGFWQGVSGSVEAADLTLGRAARREILEETGYEAGVQVFDLGRWIPFVSPLSGQSFVKRSLGAVLPAHAGPATLRLSEEHSEARLATFDEARALVRFPVNLDELAWLEARLTSGLLRP